MLKYLDLNYIKQYYKNGALYVPLLGYLFRNRNKHFPCGVVNIYGLWNDMICAIYYAYRRSLIHRRSIIWFFKALFDSYYWCEFEHYYYMERFMTKKEVKELKEKLKKA